MSSIHRDGDVPQSPSSGASSPLVFSPLSNSMFGMRPFRRASFDHDQMELNRALTTSSGQTSPATQLALTPKTSGTTSPGLGVRRHSVMIPARLPTDTQCQSWRRQYASIEQRVDQRMGILARQGFARFADAGRSVALLAGGLAGMLTFVVGPHHLILAAGIGSSVYAGLLIIGLVVELILKAWTYRRVGPLLRSELRALCEELNARELEFGAARTFEEKALCEQANVLWTEINFSGRTIVRTLARNMADFEMRPLRPMRKQEPVPAVRSTATTPALQAPRSR